MKKHNHAVYAQRHQAMFMVALLCKRVHAENDGLAM